MYTFTTGSPDKFYGHKPANYMGGAAIGIILFQRGGSAFQPGCVENATTFNYPVLFKPVAAGTCEKVVSQTVNPEVLEQLIQAGKELEEQGCRAIIGGCGYFGNYLPQVAEALTVPCFFSSLMQVPLILNSMAPSKKVGVICADGRALPGAPLLKNCGIDTARIKVAGAEVLPEMKAILEYTEWGHNPKVLEEGICEIARKMVADDPDIGSFLLECTIFPPHARAVQDAVRMPVYDFTTMIDWVYSAVVRRDFRGYI